MLIYVEMRGTYDRKVAYIFAHIPTKFEKIRLKIRGFMVKTLACGRLPVQSLYVDTQAKSHTLFCTTKQ